MAKAHKGRPPRLNWRDLRIEYLDSKRGLIQEIAKMRGYEGDGPYYWEFQFKDGTIIKIMPSGLGMPPDRD